MNTQDRKVIPSYFHKKTQTGTEHITKFDYNNDDIYGQYMDLDDGCEGREEHIFGIDNYDSNNRHYQEDYEEDCLAGYHDTSWLEGDLWELWDSGKIKIDEG